MKCVILQPSYIPWRGYFHQIASADCFIFYDDVQYDTRGWRNRNRIKSAHGSQWLTIPVHHKGSQTEHRSIQEIRIACDRPWHQEHWKTLEHCYARAPYFADYAAQLAGFYERPPDLLADFTIGLTETIAGWLGLETQFLRSSTLEACGTKTDRLIDILQKVGASHYISGPAARSYIEEDKFNRAGIRLEYMVYNYPEYPQLYPPYDPQVSILDLLFMTGPRALEYIVS